MKHIMRFTVFSVLPILFLLSSLPGLAQTHTPKYISMATRTKGYYEYLPAGYDPNGTARYPLLLFMTGVGEFGNGTASQLPRVLKNGVPKLINAGTFPSSFTVNGQTHRFIVITPQFVTSPRPVASDINAVLSYIIANYKVDTTRMYITGLSYGGGISWAHPGDNASYAKRIAATAPVASAAPLGGDSAIYARSRTIAANNVAVWAFHNNNDSTATVATTNSYISYINQSPAPTPLAKKTIFTSAGHDAWAKAYDPAYKESNMNVYEWMLQYKRAAKTIQVNVYAGSNPISHTAWNNWNLGTVEATNITSAAFKYSDGTTSAVTATLSHTKPLADNGSSYAGGMAPAQVLRHTSGYNAVRTLTLKGLSTSKTYNIDLFASRGLSTAGSTVFTVNGTTSTINVANNLTVKATFTSIKPNASGQIVVSMNHTATYNYLNGFAVSENATTTAPATKYVKTNIFGGANPYNNGEWNNWNIGTVEASNINSTAFKYSDGATSAITATLSHTRPIVDNGSTYGGGMAPAEVLRYTSSSNALRTLTVKGLSTSKTYSIELYASRGSSSAGSTVFTVNGTSVTINVVSNKTNKATFNNITPTTSGQIVVSINNTSTYNYINGFMLTEGAGGSMTTEKATDVTDPVATAIANQSRFPAVKVYPNPVADDVLLTLNNNYTGAVQVHIADAAGTVQKRFQFVKNNTLMQQSLPVSSLTNGIYFIIVQTGTQRQAVPVFKR